MIFGTDWVVVGTVAAGLAGAVSALAALVALRIAQKALKDNRAVLATNAEMAAANRRLVEIEAGRRADEVAARQAAEAAKLRANLELELHEIGKSALRRYVLVVKNLGPARAHDLTAVPVGFLGLGDAPSLELPKVQGGIRPVNLHAGEPIRIDLTGSYGPGAIPGLECTVRWLDDEGGTHHDERKRATLVRG